VIVVETQAFLREMVRDLGGVPGIGVDTEADSFHSYREKICLVQISTRDTDYIVDPIALENLSSLASVLADPAVLKVFHAAENDVANLKRDFGLQTRNLFDTRTAARILGYKNVGLAGLLREHFGVETDKRLQRYAWNTRPLDEAALNYAALDSHFLLPLRDILYRALVEAGHLEEAEEEFVRLEGVTAAQRGFDPEGFWRIKGATALDSRERAVLRELFAWRDRQAAASDRPPFRVAPDSALIAVARGRPGDLDALRALPGVPLSLVPRYSFGILAAVKRGESAEPPQPPVRRRRDDAELQRYQTLRNWRRGVADARGVEPDVIISNAVLQVLAERIPRDRSELAALELIGPWRMRTYGDSLLEALRGDH
jgi:ribonuclease D